MLYRDPLPEILVPKIAGHLYPCSLLSFTGMNHFHGRAAQGQRATIHVATPSISTLASVLPRRTPRSRN
jgi:hypothetical protein